MNNKSKTPLTASNDQSNPWSTPARLGAAALALSLLSACSMGSIFGGGGSSASLADTSATQSEISLAQSSALPAIATECPPVRVRDGSGTLAAYARGNTGSASALQYQAVIEDTSRNCVASNGLITVKMGAVGRVVMGPAGSATTINVPVRFAVERDNLAVFSEVYSIPVSIAPGAPSQEFIKVVENVSIPYLGGEDIVIWVGFDTAG